MRFKVRASLALIKVPLVDAATSIEGFTDALAALIQQPRRLGKLSAGAMTRAEELSWDKKAVEIATAYEAVLTANRLPTGTE